MTEQTIEYRTAAEPTAIAEYRPTAAALAHLRAKYAAPFDATTAPGMAAARAARAEIRDLRGKLEKTRAEIKAPVLAQGQLIDAEAKRINAELLAIEEPIDAAIRAEERRKAEEKAARERAEAERVAAIEARIRLVSKAIVNMANEPAAAVRAELARLEGAEPDPDEFGERWPMAMRALAETREALGALLAEREAREAREAEEEARLRAQQEELARQRAELDRQRQAEDAQRQAEREELARLKVEEAARQEAEAEARAEEAARQEAERTAKAARTRKVAKADPLAEIKDALAAGTLTGPEAIDRAYRLGFEAGESAARKAA
ncbi:MAG: hypothetical protein V9G18_00240 [Albidovulum sp.]